jgi:CRP/FNR family cyclic AMP-dependent transcriptional regulator
MAIDSVIFEYIVREEAYEPGSAIVQEGRRGDWIFVVLEGRLKVKKRTGKGLITVDTFAEGAILGEMVMLKGSEGLRTATVVAESKVRLGILDKDRLQKEYESLSSQLRDLMKTLALRLEETTRKASLLAVE